MNISIDRFNYKTLKQIRRIDEALFNQANTKRGLELGKLREKLVEKLFLKNQGLLNEAMRLVGWKQSEKWEDFREEFVVCFLECIDNYKLDSKAKFSSYYLDCCKGKLAQIIENVENDKKRRFIDNVSREKRFIEQYTFEHDGEKPSDEEIKRLLKMGDTAFDLFNQQKSTILISLDKPILNDEGKGSTIAELLIDPATTDANLNLVKREFYDKVVSFLTQYPFVEREVFLYGIGISGYRNYKELCKMLNISHERYTKIRKKLWFAVKKYFRYDKDIIQYIIREDQKRKGKNVCC